MESRPYSARSFIDYSKHHLNQRLRKVKKIQFFSILFISSLILLVQTIQCVQKYFNLETGTADKYVHVSKTSFPQMTICPTYPYNLGVLRENGIPTKSDIQFGANWISNSSLSPIEMYEAAVLKAEDIIEDVDIYAEAVIDGKNSFLLRANDTFCGETLFKTKEYYYNGDCFALKLPKCLEEAGILEIVFDFYNKTDIFIHHPGQFLSPNSRSRVDVDLGHFVKIAVNHEVVQLLGNDGSCAKTYGDQVDFDGCMYDKLFNLSMAKVGCTVPWLPDKSRVCTVPEKREEAFSFYQKNRRNQNDICQDSCLFTNMYFGPPVTGRAQAELKDVARAVFYFRRSIKLTTEYYLYSGLSMLAEIGGYVGLLLGVSLFKLADINNFFIDYCIEENEKVIEASNKIVPVREKRPPLERGFAASNIHM